MNYLAHALLSPPSEEILLGNMACDMIRPGDAVNLSSGIREGMELHQRIDRATDSHSAFKSLRSLLIAEKLPYAGVLVDIINDHFLAVHWNLYSDDFLMDFSTRVYDILNRKSSLIPGHFSRLSDHLCREDWFGQFRYTDGLETALYRVNYRSSKEIPVTSVMNLVREKKDDFEEGFHSLMKGLAAEFMNL